MTAKDTDDPVADIATRLSRFHVIGLNHRTCPDALREAVFVADEELPGFLQSLRQAGFGETVVLSTCDRIEVQAFFPETGHQESGDRLIDFRETVASALTAPTIVLPKPVLPAQVLSVLYHHQGLAAMKHLFRVAASLDSQIVGEPQVLGQVRASHRIAADQGMVATNLDRLLQASYVAAKRVRGETKIAEGPVSLIAVALRVARSIHGDLSRCQLAVLGADELALMLGARFKEAGVASIVIGDRNPRRAMAAARDLMAHTANFDTRGETLAQADIVISATGDRRYAITEEMVRSAVRVRRHKPVFIIDLAVPGDVDPAVERVHEAFLYDLDDLERLALEGKTGRSAAISHAEAIIEQELARFLGDFATRDVGPLIREIRDAVEAERRRILREKPAATAEEATRLLVNRLLHRPSEALRGLAAEEGLDPRTEALIRALLVPKNDGEGESGEF
jgi:glutamyl-tRNA reductase